MKDGEIQQLALKLLQADTEKEVIQYLTDADLWEDRKLWRLYGDKEGNFAQAGNQQSLPEAAVVEKVINCVDTRLMLECLRRGIGPESDQAPHSVRDAVAMFFEDRRALDNEAGTLINWSKSKRTDESRAITISVTGGRPTRGQRTKKMCITIADQGEGQSPKRIPHTILSLNEKNKQRIPFVQGKFNMGGSGALRFCGNNGMQLVISRRHPELAAKERKDDTTSNNWAVTVVRREQPSNKSGEPIHSEFTYLAPVGADKSPRKGEVLSFSADTFPIMPKHETPYANKVSWGTAIKLYEYETTVGQSNILFKDGLLYALERLMPEIALPLRLHECRGFAGKEGSFETPIAGLVVRLEDGKGDNLEPGFPKSVRIHAAGMNMTGRIYAFKEDKASTYLEDEGVIFTINGQAHGNLPKSIFSRPKSVGLSRLKDSVLVLIDCSSLTAIQREDLFMSSRDRLSKKPIRYDLEREIEQMLHVHPDLKLLQAQRREQDVASKLSDQKPLEDVLRKVFQSSPTLKNLFQLGQRLSQPFAPVDGPNKGDDPSTRHGTEPFVGKRHPTYFRTSNIPYGSIYRRNCEKGRRIRIKFDTDAENEYFDRATDRGKFELAICETGRVIAVPSYSLTLEDGEAHLNLSAPSEVEVNDHIALRAIVTDATLIEPFVNDIELTIVPQHEHLSGTARNKKKGSGTGDFSAPKGIALPNIIPVKESDEFWNRYKFTTHTACHVITDSDEVDGKTQLTHTFYINEDNLALKTEMKYSKQNSGLLWAKFKYANVLIGLAMLHADDFDNQPDSTHKKTNSDYEKQNEQETVEDRIRHASSALAPILIPMIDQLSGLNEEEMETLSTIGEDS